MNTSRYGSLSLNHVEMSLVNAPLINRLKLKCGNVASSRFSNSEYSLRGKVLNTMAKTRNTNITTIEKTL
jgi:hypothetical protein